MGKTIEAFIPTRAAMAATSTSCPATTATLRLQTMALITSGSQQ